LGVEGVLISNTKNQFGGCNLFDLKSEQSTKQESGPMIRLLPPKGFI